MDNDKRSDMKRRWFGWLNMLAVTALGISQVHAEDTEIYKASETSVPYVMLLLDTSGSMSKGINEDDAITETNPQRMATMKDALHQLLIDAGENFHIGMARYTAPGGAIMYPVKRLGDLASVERAFTGGSLADDFTADNGFVADGNELRLAAAEPGSVGVRIANVALPRGAIIDSATLVLTTNATYTGSAQVRALIAQNSNVPPITMQAEYDAITWSGDEALSDVVPEAGLQSQFSITLDVRSQLNTRMLAADWAPGNALAFKLSAVSGAIGIFSAEGARVVPRSDGRLVNQFRPHLFVKYHVNAGNPYSPPTTVRDALHGVVDLMPTVGDTPLIGAYLETAQYMHGEAVQFGNSRGNSNWRAMMRVSNLDSLNAPATLSRSSLCANEALDSRACMTEQINGAPVYASPISKDCKISPAIVMLTDGEPNNERCPGASEATGDLRCDLQKVDDRLDALTRASVHPVRCDTTNTWDCGIQLSKVLANPDDHGVDEASVPTYTISFGKGLDVGEDSPASNLIRLARGGYGPNPPEGTVVGRYYQTASKEDLSAAFRSIFGAVASGVRVQASTGISVDQSNREQHSDQLYFSLFEPSKDMLWPGNLKRYRLRAPTVASGKFDIVDAKGEVAVDGMGNFLPNRRSFWSQHDDGDSVAKGGALENLPINRTILSYLDDYPVSFPNSGLNMTALNASLASSPAYSSKLQTLLGTATDDDSKTVLNWLTRADAAQLPQMGAPLHSKPILINYSKTDSTVFLATNQGLLHAINTSDGKELFAFAPKELLGNQRQFAGGASGSQLYGLDASWIAYRNDENRDGDLSDHGDFVYLFGGMRMGGKNYYALDVTDARSQSARLKYVISPDTLIGSQKPFEKLGQTWSVPMLTRLAKACDLETPIEDCTSQVVMIFGGGYDYAAHEKTGEVMPLSNKDTVGAGLYVVDAKSGDLLWRIGGSGSGADTVLSGMDFSIPSTIRAFDSDFDGFADHLYAVDLGGQVLRFDLEKDRGRSMPRVAGKKIVAKLGGSVASNANEYRRFYDAPAITLMRDPDGKRWVSVAVGSGYRSHPMDTQTGEMFFMIRDNDPYQAAADRRTTPIVLSELSDASSGVLAGEDAEGWYIDLDRTGPSDPGEKVVGEAMVLNENLIFTTYVPDKPTMQECTPQIGSMTLYGIKLRTADAALDVNNDGTMERFVADVVPGLVAGAALVQSVVENRQQQIVNLGPTSIQLKDAGGRTLIKTRWRSNETEERVIESK